MLVKLAWRNLWRNRVRTTAIVGAIVFGLMGVTAMMGFMNGFVESMVNNAIKWQVSHIQVHHTQYTTHPDINDTIPNTLIAIEAVKNLPQVKAFSPRFVVPGMVASARSNRSVNIIGIDAAQESQVTPLSQNIQQGSWIDDKGRHPILISSNTARKLNLQVGSKVVVTFTDSSGEVVGAAFRVHGLFKTPSTTFDDTTVYVRKIDLETVANMKGTHEIALLLHDMTQTDALVPMLEEIFGREVKIRSWHQIQPMLSTMIHSMDVMNQVVLIIFVVAMMFGIVNIMLMSVYERVQEFGVLMAIGMQKHKIFMLIVMEALLLGTAGSCIGISLSAVMIYGLGVFGIPLGKMAEGLGAYGIDTILYPSVSYGEYRFILVAVLVASVIAAIYPAQQILKQTAVEAMSNKS